MGFSVSVGRVVPLMIFAFSDLSRLMLKVVLQFLMYTAKKYD